MNLCHLLKRCGPQLYYCKMIWPFYQKPIFSFGIRLEEHTCIYAYIYIYVYTYIYTYMYTCIYSHTQTHTHTHAHTHAHAHAHTHIYMWHDEEKGYSARDLVISKPCRAENYLSNDIKYVRIGQILTKLQSSEHSAVRTHRNREMTNY